MRPPPGGQKVESAAMEAGRAVDDGQPQPGAGDVAAGRIQPGEGALQPIGFSRGTPGPRSRISMVTASTATAALSSTGGRRT